MANILKQSSRLLLALLACSAAAGNAARAEGGVAGAEPLRVMSVNVRYPADDGADAWPYRRQILVDTIARADPDVVGTQELFQIQGEDVVAALPQYRWFGIDRRGGHADEHMGIFYRTDRLKVVQQGQFWLSATPMVVGSRTWGNILPRMVNWALFERLADRRRFYLLDTHLPYRDKDEKPREKSARMIAQWIATLPATIPVIVTGDFNTGPDTKTHTILTGALKDARATTLGHRGGPEGTFHGFTGKPQARIDWILSRGLTASAVATIDSDRSGHYPSDHFPVVAQFAWDDGRP